MTVHQHLLSGTFPSGDWEIGLYTETDTGTLPTAHAAWEQASAELWGPPTAPNVGVYSVMPLNVIATLKTTYTISTLNSSKVAKLMTVANVAGTSNGNRMPAQVSPVVSLIGVGLTPPARGRMYLPCYSNLVSADGRISAPSVVAMVNAVVAALHKFQALGHTPVLFNRKTLETNPIVSVRIDQFPGVRQNRRNSVAPVYSSAVL